MTKAPFFEEIKTRRVFEAICEQIRDRLEQGILKPSDKLPAERDLAMEFKVGRPAVREALRMLEQAGVLEFRKGTKGGAFVRDGDPTMLRQSLHDLLLVGRVSVENLAEARSLICGVVVEVACRRGTDADFDAIEQNIVAIESSIDLYQRAEEGVRFFKLIAEATHNEVLVILINALSDILRAIMDKTGRKARPELIPLRRDLLKCMRARHPVRTRKSLETYMDALHAPILSGQRENRAKAAIRTAARKSA